MERSPASSGSVGGRGAAGPRGTGVGSGAPRGTPRSRILAGCAPGRRGGPPEAPGHGCRGRRAGRRPGRRWGGEQGLLRRRRRAPGGHQEGGGDGQGRRRRRWPPGAGARSRAARRVAGQPLSSTAGATSRQSRAAHSRRRPQVPAPPAGPGHAPAAAGRRPARWARPPAEARLGARPCRGQRGSPRSGTGRAAFPGAPGLPLPWPSSGGAGQGGSSARWASSAKPRWGRLRVQRGLHVRRERPGAPARRGLPGGRGTPDPAGASPTLIRNTERSVRRDVRVAALGARPGEEAQAGRRLVARERLQARPGLAPGHSWRRRPARGRRRPRRSARRTRARPARTRCGAARRGRSSAHTTLASGARPRAVLVNQQGAPSVRRTARCPCRRAGSAPAAACAPPGGPAARRVSRDLPRPPG